MLHAYSTFKCKTLRYPRFTRTVTLSSVLNILVEFSRNLPDCPRFFISKVLEFRITHEYAWTKNYCSWMWSGKRWRVNEKKTTELVVQMFRFTFYIRFIWFEEEESAQNLCSCNGPIPDGSKYLLKILIGGKESFNTLLAFFIDSKNKSVLKFSPINFGVAQIYCVCLENW